MAEVKITILVNPGNFAGIEEAAISEEKVDWWDEDLTDDRACTECFAAMELSRFLAACLDLDKNNIKLEKPDKLPEGGDVFVLGSRESNSLITELGTAKNIELKTDESFCIHAFTESGRVITIIEGKDRVGTLYGVYTYLEQLGIRFYGLGDKLDPNTGKVVPVTNLIQEGHSGKEEIKSANSYKVPSHGTVLPEKAVELPRDLNIIENPSYFTRGFWAWENGHGNEEFSLWMARNKMNLWAAADKRVYLLKKLGMKLIDGGHTIQKMFLNPNGEYPYNHPKFDGGEDKPIDPYPVSNEYTGAVNEKGQLTYFGAHPEWYGLYDGKRSDNIGENFGHNYCTSNEDATKELAKNLVKSLISGEWKYGDVVNFWMLDSERAKANWCECQNCTRQGSCTDRILTVAGAVLKSIKSARKQGRLNRDIHLSTIAYQETLETPSKPLPLDFDYDNFSVTFFPIERCYVHPLVSPKCTEINQFMLENYSAWTSNDYYKGAFFIGEYYNVSSTKSMPVVFTNIMAADIPWYYETGTKHFNYMHTPTRRWGTWTVNQSLLAKLLWNHKFNVNEFLNDFYELYYPTTTVHMRKFYNYLEKGLSNIKAFKHLVYSAKSDDSFYMLRRNLADENAEIFAIEHLKYDTQQVDINSGPSILKMIDNMKKARKQIDTAIEKCDDTMEQERLLEDEQRFEYGEMIAFFYHHLVKTAIFHRKGDKDSATNDFKYVEQYAQKLRKVTDLVHVSSSHSNAINGFEAALAWPVGINPYEFFKEKYGKN
ncbi:MAG: DUF4838 domain-containing protein [Planctomycetota bacterium]|jgi:hypothetical protein